ncbi:MAG: alpha-amylase/4-alpha-glucanotransferase domain-containing protein [Promethearchaeota archaeon]
MEDCFNKSYGPLINTIYEHPNVKITFHFSGNLLEWFIKKKPEIIKKIKEMASRGQIEIIGGGYYEPIFSIIPYRDKIAQIRKLSHLIHEEFGLDVKGAWLSERVWEPNYPSFLSDVGLTYVIVDDNHFRSSGITQEETLYTYITEDEGKTLRVFPINEPIRYLTPWKPTYMTIDYLKEAADENGDRVALMISDAEKMGVWGTTHQICYIEGYGHQEGDNGKPFIPAFLKQVENNKWIKSITPSEYIEQFPAKNLVYLPTASYDKMEEWVLPTDVRKKFSHIIEFTKKYKTWKEAYQFLKGGFWRYFLVKYPESNNMHKKMLHVRQKLLDLESKIKKLKDLTLISTLKPKVLEAWDEIYKGQCNDCYWHGMFGGVYLQFLRFSVYTHLINAEKLIDEMNGLIVSHQSSYMSIEPLDFNKDSKMDVLIESDILNVYINPSNGGTIFEIDFKPKSYNILNTLTRWPEAYHDNEKIEKGEIMVDRFRRSMLRVRIFYDDVTIEQIEADIYQELGDFVDGNFSLIKSEINGQKALIEMQKEGMIKNFKSGEGVSCVISKTIIVENNQLFITINGKLKENNENEEILRKIIEKLNLAVDIPFFFNGNPNEFQWESKQSEFDENLNMDLLEPFLYSSSHFKVLDRTYELNFEIDLNSESNQIKIGKFPIIAYAFTDEGYKKIYQGVNVIPMIKLTKSFEIELKLQFY